MTTRTLARIIPAVSISGGAGVELRRSLGSPRALRHDAFLMPGEFFADDPGGCFRGLGEPMVQYGPFVRDTQAEIGQAPADCRDGTLAAPNRTGRSAEEVR